MSKQTVWVGFNHARDNEDRILRECGAVLKDTRATKYPPFEDYVIEIESIDDIGVFVKRVIDYTDTGYNAILSFNPVRIFLEKEDYL